MNTNNSVMKQAANILSSILLSGFLILGATVTHAQDNDITRQELDDISSLSGVVPTKSVTETAGNPYLNPNFLKGKIMVSENTATKDLYLRYNCEKNSVEFVRNDEIMVTDANKISGFKIFTDNGDVIFKNGFNADIEQIGKNTLLRIVYNGNVKLLARHSATLMKDLASYSSATQKNKYVKKLHYYLVTKDGTFHKVKLKKDEILPLLKGNTEKLSQFAEEKNLSFEKEQDLRKILRHYDKAS